MTNLPEGFDAVLEHLKVARGFDFTGYKTASLQRRIAKRIEAVEAGSYSEYLDYLQVHTDEFALLFNTVLINVTAFFRDQEAWDALADAVLPEILASHEPQDPIRVWCAGCASGEEAYSIAILLCEALGETAFRERVKIYGTDVDEEALDQARQGTYFSEAVEAVPAELRSRYFVQDGDAHAFRKDLRRALIFGRNDLVQDAPISRVDLLTCRNTLMYFNADTQRRILRRFHFALRPEGRLFLGKSEMLLSRGELFQPIDLGQRIFGPVAIPESVRQRVPLTGGRDGERASPLSPAAAFDLSPVAQLVVDRERTLTLVNEAARRMLGVVVDDIGRPLQDLRVSYRPKELRAGLDTVFSEGLPLNAGTVDVESDTEGDDRTLDIQLLPIRWNGEVAAVTVAFVDVTPHQRLEAELEHHKTELNAAYEELQSTIEELETTNEELQSSNEELETTNEELQSTNEELETMNEELQSSNEELANANDELRARSSQLDEANAFMDTILTSMGVGVIVVDGEQHVRIWNTQSEELWGVRATEAAGQHVLSLDIGLPLEGLRSQLRQALTPAADSTELTVQAIDRRGRSFQCAVTILPLQRDAAASPAAIILAQRVDPPPQGPPASPARPA